jgi:predicted transcriptional regulator
MNYTTTDMEVERAMHRAEPKMAGASEPEIVQVARAFDEAQRELQMLDQQRRKLQAAEKDAQGRLKEYATRLRVLIEAPTMAEPERPY